MANVILLVAAIILLSLLLTRASRNLGIPTLFIFIVLGMVFGSDGLIKIPFSDFNTAEYICSTALIFIMFYGGFSTNWASAKTVAVKAALLSSLGTVLTALFTGLFCYYALHFDFLESMLIGAVISSTDAASVFSILRSKRLNLKYGTASMLEVESGSNDPFSYMLTVLVLAAMNSTGTWTNLAIMVFMQVLVGAAVGVAIAYATAFVLCRFTFIEDGFDTIFVFSVALFAYAGASVLGGNGYLSAYMAGIVLGNRPLPNKKELVHFFDGLTGLTQMLIFFLLGLLSFPSTLSEVFWPSLAIVLFLTFVARPLSVFMILTPFRAPLAQQLVVAWAGFRGAASIVFAIIATVDPAYMKNDVFHIVFFMALFSISLQGSLIVPISKRLKMIDDRYDVMKTFSDYSGEIPVEFIKLTISEHSPWVNKRVKDLMTPPNVMIPLLLRDNHRVIPTSDTVVQVGDVLVLSTLSSADSNGGSIAEVLVEKGNSWIGQALPDIKLEHRCLVIYVKRAHKLILPQPHVVIAENDVLVISEP